MLRHGTNERSTRGTSRSNTTRTNRRPNPPSPLGLTQSELARQADIFAATLSLLENGHQELDGNALESLAEGLGCTTKYLTSEKTAVPFDRPKLRAYADASQRSVNRTLYDTAAEAIRSLSLRTLGMRVPNFDGDLNDDQAIDRIAADVCALAGLNDTEVVPNVIRAVERLGCVASPLDGELGKHRGMSLAVGEIAVVRVTRPFNDPEFGHSRRSTALHSGRKRARRKQHNVATAQAIPNLSHS